MLKTLLCVALVSASATVFAQSSPQPRAERRFDCSKTQDPKACEERVEKAKAGRAKARKACEGKSGDAQRDCMRREMCAQTSDPAKCEANVKERTADRARIREACKDKKGDELRACIREHRQKK
jgi:hypothetical protein